MDGRTDLVDTDYVLCCDEFGNTGANLADPKQPVFLYAFVLLPEDSLDPIDEELRQIYVSEGLEFRELKSVKLTSSKTALRRCERIGLLLETVGATVTLAVVEKRYQIAAMVGETYLDPNYNPRGHPEAASAKYRQTLADGFSTALSDALLAEFLDAVRRDEPSRLRELSTQIADLIQFHPTAAVSDAAHRMHDLEERHIFRYGRKRDGAPPNAHHPTSQAAVFYAGLQRVDYLLEELGMSATLVRDRDSIFGSVLDFTIDAARKVGGDPRAAEYGAKRPLDRIPAAVEVRAQDHVGVQMADLAAGLAGRALTDAVRGRAIGTALRNAIAPWRRSFRAEAHDHYLMVSDHRLQSVLEVLGV